MVTRRSLVLIVAGVIAGGGMAVGWQAYSQSVRYGSGDPCGIVAKRVIEDYQSRTGGPLSASFAVVSAMQRQLEATVLESRTELLRQDAAAACWLSVLAGRPTASEKLMLSLNRVAEVEHGWRKGSAPASNPQFASSIARTHELGTHSLEMRNGTR